MKHHVVWAILAVVTFTGHMVAGLYFEFMFFLPEYIWFVSVALSVLAIYAGTITATGNEPYKRGVAFASAVIGVIILLGLCISASSWLFVPENGFDMMANVSNVLASI
ncbi:hypothetical protein ACFLYR_03410 [Chloroflexota bacterium]